MISVKYYDIVDADNPMAYDRLFNGVRVSSFSLELFTGYSVGNGCRVYRLSV